MLPVRMARRAINAVKAARVFRQQVRFLKERRIGLVHLNNSIVRHHDWKLASLVAGVPCVSHERGLPEYSSVSRWLGSRLALLVPMSQCIADHMVKGGVAPHNIRVMYDGLDPKAVTVTRSADDLRREWQVEPGQPVIGIVGNIRDWKGQDIVVRAVIEVVRSRPDLVCFFVGAASKQDAAFEAELHRLVREAGIERNVRFTGYQKDVSSFMNMMDFVIHASRNPEPFGMVVLEAMAQRKAVIGSGAGGPTEIIIEGVTGYTFPPGDHEALAGHIRTLLGDPAAAARMGEAGYARLIEAFTIDKYMDQIHGAYGRLVGRSPRAIHAENLAAARVQTDSPGPRRSRKA